MCVLIVTNKNCNMVFIQMRDQDCLYWGHISCDKTQNMPFVLILSYHGHWKLQVTGRLYTVQWHIMGDYWLYGQNLLTTISNDIFKSIHCSQLKSRLKIPPGTLGNECCILDGKYSLGIGQKYFPAWSWLAVWGVRVWRVSGGAMSGENRSVKAAHCLCHAAVMQSSWAWY